MAMRVDLIYIDDAARTCFAQCNPPPEFAHGPGCMAALQCMAACVNRVGTEVRPVATPGFGHVTCYVALTTNASLHVTSTGVVTLRALNVSVGGNTPYIGYASVIAEPLKSCVVL